MVARKFNILGKKRKGEERRRVGLSRSLSVLKEERRKRMAGAENPSDEDRDTTSEDDESAKRPKHLSGDDLGDSFSRSVKSKPKVGWIDEVLRKENTRDLESEDGTSSWESEDDDEGSEEGRQS